MFIKPPNYCLKTKHGSYKINYPNRKNWDENFEGWGMEQLFEKVSVPPSTDCTLILSTIKN